ncbi:MAG: hypothetical protein QF521_22670 [Alphaproteobacteria bacterium]|nr:hypothetical protein [Alphaproteobacteria bacterium]
MDEVKLLPKSLPIFSSRADFRIPTPNSNALPLQQGRGGATYVTASGNFLQQVVRGRGGMMQELGSIKVKNLPVKRWKHQTYRKRSILFLLPPPAIGEHVAIRLFLQAFMERAKPREIALLGADAASDVYAGMQGVAVYPAWMAHDELRRFNVVIDLNDVPARREIEFWPVDMEAALHELFGLPVPVTGPTAPVARHDGPLRIGILPLASSPMRTLPPALILSLVQTLSGEGMTVEIVLNRQQDQSRLLQTALDAAALDLHYHTDTKSVADLLALMAQFDYGVFADSGPAHLSKLQQRPGAAIFTSAPSDLLLGRHRNLRPIQAQYSSDFCQAPCGLAKVRQTADGRIGCMASLGVEREALPAIVTSPDRDQARRLLLESPIPCVAALDAAAKEIAAAIREDLAERLS